MVDPHISNGAANKQLAPPRRKAGAAAGFNADDKRCVCFSCCSSHKASGPNPNSAGCWQPDSGRASNVYLQSLTVFAGLRQGLVTQRDLSTNADLWCLSNSELFVWQCRLQQGRKQKFISGRGGREVEVSAVVSVPFFPFLSFPSPASQWPLKSN